MSMTRKDYVAIAGAIAAARKDIESPTALWAVDRVVDKVSRVLQADNLRFDRERFLKACRYGEAAS